MANEEMGMAAAPAPSGAQAGISPDQMAIYEQMRQNISPKEFSDEMLAGAEQVDPQAVATFRKELDALDVPMEVLDALNNLVDEILANPENYDEIRQRYMDQGIPEDILPEQFDPNFFAALNMAIDQMIAEPAGPQAFAKGGIAELSPISKAVADYGRNGDTMLAHITPAEARMLRRRGGAGTTNPKTGLPEFFSLGGIFKSIGNAVKGFVNSTVGKVVTTVALGFFLGPAAANFLGVTSAAGVAAVGGFIGSAGSTLLGGGNLRDALKAGAMGGLTAGALGGVTQGFDTAYAGPTTVGGQVDAFKGMLPGGTPPVPATAPIPTTAAPLPNAPADSLLAAPGGAPVPTAPPMGVDATEFQGSLAKGNVPAAEPSLFEQGKDLYNKNISPGGIKAAAEPAAQKAGADAVTALQTRVPSATPAMLETAYQGAYKSAMPGMFSTYGPAVGLGIGALGMAGAFTPSETETEGLPASATESPSDRIKREGTQKKYYVQGLPGVQYDEYGAPIAGGYNPFPSAGLPDYNAGGMRMPATIGGIQGIMPRQALYATPSGSIGGNRTVAQPYNNSNMYSNLIPRGYKEGGDVDSSTGGSASGALDRNTAMTAQQQQIIRDMAIARSKAPGGKSPEQELYDYAKTQNLSNAQIDTMMGFPTGATDKWFAGQSTVSPPYVFTGDEKIPFVGGVAGPTVDKPWTPDQVDVVRTIAGPGTVANPGGVATGTGTTVAQQQTARNKVAQNKAMRRAAGSGTMYANINAGLSALAPEDYPGGPVTLSPDRSRFMIDAVNAAKPTSDIDYARLMEQQGIRPEETAAMSGRTYGDINRRVQTANRQSAYAPMLEGQRNALTQQAGVAASGQLPSDLSGYSGQDMAGLYRGLGQQGLNDAQIRAAAGNRYGMQTDTNWQALQNAVANPSLYTERPTTVPPPAGIRAGNNPSNPEQNRAQPFNPYSNITNAPSAYTGPNLYSQALATGMMPSADAMMAGYQRMNQQGATDAQIRNAAETMFGPQGNVGWNTLTAGASALTQAPPPRPERLMNTGGIAGLAQGGYPRRTGQISGPGTEKSDSIPAMLSDGEFVMTAKAVRAAGKGDRRAGAKRMYKLMHQLEKNSGRG
jgi:hypothetical protein